MWCGAVWCGVVRYGAVWYSKVRCGAVWCGVVRCYLLPIHQSLSLTWFLMYSLVHIQVRMDVEKGGFLVAFEGGSVFYGPYYYWLSGS